MKLAPVLFPASCLASVTVHLLIFATPAPVPPVAAGGAVTGEIALGDSFANLVNGHVQGSKTTRTPIQHSAAPPLAPSPEMSKLTAQAQTKRPLTAHKPASLYAVSPALVSRAQPATRAAVAPAKPAEPKSPVPKPKVLKPTPERKPPATQSAKGNAKANAVAGQSTGKPTGTKAEANTKTKTSASHVGQKAISSYKTKLLRKIRRSAQRTRSGGATGQAVVAMRINANGSLSGLQIVKGSGNARVDATALKAVQKAAPFSPAPKGAGLSLSVIVKVGG